MCCGLPCMNMNSNTVSVCVRVCVCVCVCVCGPGVPHVAEAAAIACMCMKQIHYAHDHSCLYTRMQLHTYMTLATFSFKGPCSLPNFSSLHHHGQEDP